MEPYTIKDDWLYIDGPSGGNITPLQVTHMTAAYVRDIIYRFDRLANRSESPAVPDELREYTEDSEIYDIKLYVNKWGARLSADGTMDFTAWNAPHDSEQAAMDALEEEYPDAFEDEDDEETDSNHEGPHPLRDLGSREIQPDGLPSDLPMDIKIRLRYPKSARDWDYTKMAKVRPERIEHIYFDLANAFRSDRAAFKEYIVGLDLGHLIVYDSFYSHDEAKKWLLSKRRWFGKPIRWLGGQTTLNARLVRTLRPTSRQQRFESLDEVSPPGFSGTVQAMKDKGMDDEKAFKLAWSMYKKGHKAHVKPKRESEARWKGREDKYPSGHDKAAAQREKRKAKIREAINQFYEMTVVGNIASLPTGMATEPINPGLNFKKKKKKKGTSARIDEEAFDSKGRLLRSGMMTFAELEAIGKAAPKHNDWLCDPEVNEGCDFKGTFREVWDHQRVENHHGTFREYTDTRFESVSARPGTEAVDVPQSVVDRIRKLRGEVTQPDLARAIGVPIKKFKSWFEQKRIPRNHLAALERALRRYETSLGESEDVNEMARPSLHGTIIDFPEDLLQAVIELKTRGVSRKHLAKLLWVTSTELNNWVRLKRIPESIEKKLRKAVSKYLKAGYQRPVQPVPKVVYESPARESVTLSAAAARRVSGGPCCAACGQGLPKYPGRYPKACPGCGKDLKVGHGLRGDLGEEGLSESYVQYYPWSMT
jgi:DNA-binding transcriptional regulator YiaG